MNLPKALKMPQLSDFKKIQQNISQNYLFGKKCSFQKGFWNLSNTSGLWHIWFVAHLVGHVSFSEGFALD
jgi:hypothetical protein